MFFNSKIIIPSNPASPHKYYLALNFYFLAHVHLNDVNIGRSKLHSQNGYLKVLNKLPKVTCADTIFFFTSKSGTFDKKVINLLQ